MDSLVVDAESIGTVLSKPTQQLRSRVPIADGRVGFVSTSRSGQAKSRSFKLRRNSFGFSAAVSDGCPVLLGR